jgi:hypothetical protein
MTDSNATADSNDGQQRNSAVSHAATVLRVLHAATEAGNPAHGRRPASAGLTDRVLACRQLPQKVRAIIS